MTAFSKFIIFVFVIATALTVGFATYKVGLKYVDLQNNLLKNEAIQQCLDATTYTTQTTNEKGDKITVEGVTWDAYSICLKDKGYETAFEFSKK